MKPSAAILLVLALAIGGEAAAATLVTPGEFETMSEGNTLYFDRDGVPFGAEQYFPDRRSLWRFDATGDCAEGSWRPQGDLICFAYDDATVGPECWRFLRDGTGLRAALVEDGSESGFALDLSHSDTRPLDCPGPDVGS